MSKRPKLFGRKEPTWAVKGEWSSHATAHEMCSCPGWERRAASAMLVEPCSDSDSSPVEKRVVVPARHAYSHSASRGRRQAAPSLPLSHSQNATASCHATLLTGWSSVCVKPGFRQV